MHNDRHRTSRREFMQQTAAGVSIAGFGSSAWGAVSAEGEMPMRDFGTTGEKVAILGVGGHAIGQIKGDQESIDFVREAIDLGATFLDNAWEYHDGRSEELMGRALLDGYRDKVFLMTKHHGRKDKATAMEHLEDSLRRLQTETIDLWQYHEVVYEADPDLIFSEGGAIEAAADARQQGKVRYIGFTGHKDPAIFKKMLSHDFKWDAVQMPVNVMDPHYRSFIKEILPILNERGIAPIAMKTMGGGHILSAKVVEPEEALRFAWSQPVATLVSGMNSREILHKNVETARNFTPMSDEDQLALLEKTKPLALAGKFEPFKSTRAYDGPVGRKIHGIEA
jgi:predicted aldo/keto reductase-like oxidoreductase